MKNLTKIDQLNNLCKKIIEEKNYDQSYLKRLENELYEIEAQGEENYFLELYNKSVKFEKNENNILIPYLLGIVDDFDISKDFNFVRGEFPDVDIDYLTEVRDYLKNVWAAEKYGQENICSIGTYSTLGIKSGILDMAKIYGYDKAEIQAITVKMKDKDEEGELLEWDKALEIYPDFKDYCDRHVDVAASAKMLLDRNRSGGVHAGGLIIANCPISDFVPLEVRSIDKENPDGVIVSAWSEGQATQDLQPVGLIKFDMLIVSGLKQLGYCIKLIKERHNIKNICALEGGKDWSDISYLNDPKSIALANKADLKAIFQFDSDGIRKLVKAGGITCFEDLPAYSSLYRPGPMKLGMHNTYVKRKRGEEKYSLHPLLEKVLGKTYGVMVFQEQVMKILNIVGDIPLIHCEKIRKAISKKKEKDFISYKEKFIINGQKNLSCDLEFINDLWAQVEAFSGYGFNASHAYAYAYIAARQLYLKTYYPLEFYCSVLICEKDQSKIKEYKIDAKKHGVEIMGVDINKSKENFVIDEEGKIYFGFEKIKGIGSDIAKKIVQGQPYQSLPDFLNRFGTESKVVKPLIGLGVFDDPYDKVVLYKFYEFFKDQQSKEDNRRKRHEKTLISLQTQLEGLLEQYLPDTSILNELNKFDDPSVQQRWKDLFEYSFIEEKTKFKDTLRVKKTSVYKKIINLVQKRDKSISTNEEKIQQTAKQKISDFNHHNYILEKSIEDLMKDEKLAESEFYGFNWVHELEESPHYTNLTFDDFEQSQQPAGPVEIIVKQAPVKKTSLKGNTYWSMEVEDAMGKNAWITIWEDDYIRFKDEFKSNNLLRIWINPPFGNFPSYSLQSPKKHERARVLPKNKHDDKRVFLMERKKKPTVVVNIKEEEFDIL